MNYETIIGLEVHAELLTASKLWCGCSTAFGNEPNTQVCPICLGLPGTLPVLNEKAVEYAVKAGLALGCRIAEWSRFDRKQYFYPDLPKAYQISQYDLPLCREGRVVITVDGLSREVGILRVHLEEEAGKLVHSGESLHGSEYSLVDYNRGGIPLIEIVTAPDLRSPEEARIFLERLRTVLRYIGVSDCKMEEGSLRCDANVNLRIKDEEGEYRTPIVEIKNLNSFRAVERALTYEVRRQVDEFMEKGRPPAGTDLSRTKVTAGWNEALGRTYVQRQKELADDYRYFPDPDLPPVVLSSEQVEKWRAELPELPEEKESRFRREYGLPAYDAAVLTASRAVADLFEETARLTGDAKMVSNWVMGEVFRLLKGAGDDLEQALRHCSITPAALAELLLFVKNERINANSGKEVLEEMYRTGKAATQIIAEKGLEQISGRDQLAGLVAEVIAAHPGVVEDIKNGKKAAIGFLVGQVMKATKGKANPKLVNELITQSLS
ncbi:MAG TPA: Asp-tRNA(Asn)/Glu-tRNA(Gln) amidotransferase subunit GatB [Firmicutes bacterium]|nr:Asp-tRNA(Asn)/Glu-tRNA(Gln) amidotransferase subunit GatB [Bacillota bacterium]